MTKQHVILCGFQGSGKTTLGRKVAALLGYSFIDSDHLIMERFAQEKGVHKSCREIFREEGEEGFRKREREAIAAFHPEGPTLFATGGGALLDPQNRRKIESMGWIIFLDAPLDLLHQRTQGVRSLFLPQEGEFREAFERVYLQRRPLYLQVADHVVEIEDKEEEELVAELLYLIRDLCKCTPRVEGSGSGE